MKKPNRWKSLSTQEKMMIVFIVLLVIAIITRWAYVRDETGNAFKERFSPSKTDQAQP